MVKANSAPLKHTIGVVSRRTGLKPDLIRVWEKRYGAVAPGRTATNRRYYTDEQVEKLLLLRHATSSGRSIAQVAGLSIPELRNIVQEDRVAMDRVSRPEADFAEAGENEYLASCMEAIEGLDPRTLRYHLEKAASALSEPKLVEELIIPLVEEIGRRWEKGSLRIVHEHAASAVIKAFLANMHVGYPPDDNSPAILVGTPAGQNHEIGALIASNTAVSEGWDVVYLGPGVPAEDFAAAVLLKKASAVALSLVYPGDDPYLPAELRKLRRLLGSDVQIIVGGKGVPGYMEVLEEIFARVVLDTDTFRVILRQIRS